MLCVDDKEASVLRAIELLLAYPELNALPIVNPANYTVVAHVTLASLLAYIAIHTRDEALQPLAEIEIAAGRAGGPAVLHFLGEEAYRDVAGALAAKDATEEQEGTTPRPPKQAFGGPSGAADDHNVLDEKVVPVSGEMAKSHSGSSSVSVVNGGTRQVLSVMREDMCLEDALKVFAHEGSEVSAIPIVGAEGPPQLKGALSGRNVLQYLDFCMQEQVEFGERRSFFGQNFVKFIGGSFPVCCPNRRSSRQAAIPWSSCV